jgi:hypothetical protein
VHLHRLAPGAAFLWAGVTPPDLLVVAATRPAQPGRCTFQPTAAKRVEYRERVVATKLNAGAKTSRC